MTRTSGVGEVSQLAIIASITCPWLASATSRTGHSSSMIPATFNWSRKDAMTGSDPSARSKLGGP